MAADWLSNSSAVTERIRGSLERGLHDLSKPQNAKWLRRGLGLLLAIWAVVSLARLIWAFIPAANVEMPTQLELINPLLATTTVAPPAAVNIETMQSWHLFGEAGASLPVVVAQPQPAPREGIEQDAKETRLKLVLRGAVASSEDGLGHAIIEYQRKQAVYAVEDQLPVPGEVILAKVLPRQVVLDNGGTYELLTLFEDGEFGSQAATPGVLRPEPDQRAPAAAQIDKRADEEATELAQSYRDRLYENPQSLADVVNVSAVRDGERLLGYRISPGKEQAQFSELGFKAGDLVTRVNGIALDDPANTMRLYQTMRTATEAVFELKRKNQPISISVSLSPSGE